MERTKTLVAAALLVTASGFANAETAKDPLTSRDDRYSVTKLENGYLRLDKRTGDMSHCVIDEHEAWQCVILPETRQRHEKKIEALAAENAFLKARQKAMEAHLAEVEETLADLRDRLGEPEPEAANRKPGDPEPLVSKQERKRLNEVLDGADAMLRRFGDMMLELKKDAEKLGSKIPKILD